MQLFERYWLFAAVCLIVGLYTLRLILRERLSLPGSLALLGFLGAMAGVALFPNLTSVVAQRMGFTLPSNFFFALCIAILAVLYLGSLVTLSRVELRTIALTQEVGLLREQLERRAATEKFAPAEKPAPTPQALHADKPDPRALRLG
jgi:hypothetical protein